MPAIESEVSGEPTVLEEGNTDVTDGAAAAGQALDMPKSKGRRVRSAARPITSLLPAAMGSSRRRARNAWPARGGGLIGPHRTRLRAATRLLLCRPPPPLGP